jgi:hypothetical protein
MGGHAPILARSIASLLFPSSEKSQQEETESHLVVSLTQRLRKQTPGTNKRKERSEQR